MKKILFPATYRAHKARQAIFLDNLSKTFTVDVVEYESPYKDILNAVADYANYFREVLKNGDYDLVIIRGDRFEMLPIAMLSAYRDVPIAHIEGGDLSGVIDNKVRHAITQLSEIHFATTEEAQARIVSMGVAPSRVFNYGSLDVEYAKNVVGDIEPVPPFILVSFHPIPGEDPAVIDKALKEYGGEVIRIQSNRDYQEQYGKESYKPEEYIKLLAGAECLVGNSSSFLKEASIFGTPVVNVGDRQKNRKRPSNVMDCPCQELKVKNMLIHQLNNGRYEPDYTYYKEDTSTKICSEIGRFLSER